MEILYHAMLSAKLLLIPAARLVMMHMTLKRASLFLHANIEYRNDKYGFIKGMFLSYMCHENLSYGM